MAYSLKFMILIVWGFKPIQGLETQLLSNHYITPMLESMKGLFVWRKLPGASELYVRQRQLFNTNTYMVSQFSNPQG